MKIGSTGSCGDCLPIFEDVEIIVSELMLCLSIPMISRIGSINVVCLVLTTKAHGPVQRFWLA